MKRLADPDVTDDTAAPTEPMDVRLTIDLTQVSGWGQQSSLYFKINVVNDSLDPIEFKVADLELKADDQAVPQVIQNQQINYGYPIFADASMQVQLQQGAVPMLKDVTLSPGAAAEGWMAFNLAEFQQVLFVPGGLSGKSWILEGKVGPHPIRFDLKAAEVALISEKPRPSKLDPSVQVIEIGPRINAINAAKVLELLRTIPPTDRGCVLVLKEQNCLFDNLATQHFQQQMFQIHNQNNQPVVSNEGRISPNNFYGSRGYFSYGQVQTVASEVAGVLMILGRRPDTGPALIKHLGDEKRETRAAAANALTQHLGEDNVIFSLTKACTDIDATVRMAAVTALGGGGQPAQPGMRLNGSIDTVAVVKAMTDPEAGVRMTAAQTANVFPCDDVGEAC